MSGRRMTRRERIYEAARGDQEFPLCNIPGCGLPVLPGQRWAESHMPIPKAFAGQATGVAHFRCNAVHGAEVVTPAAAKSKRQRKDHVGITGPGRGRCPMPCGRASSRTKPLHGAPKPRLTLAQKLRALEAAGKIIARERVT